MYVLDTYHMHAYPLCPKLVILSKYPTYLSAQVITYLGSDRGEIAPLWRLLLLSRDAITERLSCSAVHPAHAYMSSPISLP